MNRILVIDDDVAFCKMLSSFLTRNSYDVQTAYSAQAAKEMASTEKPFDLFITDLRLPDDDGIDLMVTLLKQFPSTPVILMTGYSDVTTAVKALKNGAADYITKPLNLREDYPEMPPQDYLSEEAKMAVAVYLLKMTN